MNVMKGEKWDFLSTVFR